MARRTAKPSDPVDDQSDVRSMAEFLRGTLSRADHMDRELHAFRDDIARRLYALELIEDPAFGERVTELRADIERGGDGGVSGTQLKEEFLRPS